MSATTSTNAKNNGHETNGRFATGNAGGPGNPFARQTAALRQAMLDAVSAEDMKGIVYALVLKAQGGDLGATKLLLQYVVGKPQPAVNPDTLDAQELQQLQASSLPAEAIEDFMQSIPVDLALTTLHALTPALTQRFGEVIVGPEGMAEVEARLAAEPEEAEYEDEDEDEPPVAAKPQRVQSPSPNGFNGAIASDSECVPEETGATPPSPNGRNGSLFDSLAALLGRR